MLPKTEIDYFGSDINDNKDNDVLKTLKNRWTHTIYQLLKNSSWMPKDIHKYLIALRLTQTISLRKKIISAA